MTLSIRNETPADYPAVRLVNQLAFARPEEANLVETLREVVQPLISLVAVQGDQVVGHILFSPMTIEPPGDTPLLAMGLGPMAVLPAFHNQGIGTQLVNAGLQACQRLGCGLAVVLGHPQFYPRCGFRPASQFGLRCEWDVPDEVFMAIELLPGAAAGLQGLVKYHPAFEGV